MQVLIQTCKLFPRLPVCYRHDFTGIRARQTAAIALKRTLTPLEDVTLACVLGLVVSGVVYWLMMFVHQGRFYLVWPLTAAGVYVWLRSSKRKSLLSNSATLGPLSQGSATPSRDRSALVLAGVLSLAIIALAFFPIYYTNFTWQPEARCASIRYLMCCFILRSLTS